MHTKKPTWFRSNDELIKLFSNWAAREAMAGRDSAMFEKVLNSLMANKA